MAAQVKYPDNEMGTEILGVLRREHDPLSVGGPVRIHLRVLVFRKDRLRSATVSGNKIAFQAVLLVLGAEEYLGAVRRPARQGWVQGRRGQLLQATSIASGSPQNPLREGHVGNGLTVRRISDLFGGDTTEIGMKFPGLRVITVQLATRDDAVGEYSLSVFAGNGGILADRT